MDATIEDRTEVSVLLGMMTFNSLPLTNGSPFTRMQSLGSNLGYGFISHKLGDVKDPWLTMKAGAFPYGYSSSNNLGGYLYTGGTYPGTLTSNFWSLIDGNDYAAQGAMGHFSFLEDALKIDATLFFEHDLEPNYDLSPGIVASYNLGGMVEVGAGAVFSHLIAWQEKAVTPKLRSNAYTGSNTSGQRLPESEWNKPGLESNRYPDRTRGRSQAGRHFGSQYAPGFGGERPASQISHRRPEWHPEFPVELLYVPRHQGHGADCRNSFHHRDKPRKRFPSIRKSTCWA